MDLVYMPEVMTYGALRAPTYRDYEQPWNKDYFNYGKSSSLYCPRQLQQQQQLLRSQSKDNCHLCKESKRRRLAAYIRGKPRLNSCSEVHEEAEEEEEHEEHEKAHPTESPEKKEPSRANGKSEK